MAKNPKLPSARGRVADLGGAKSPKLTTEYRPSVASADPQVQEAFKDAQDNIFKLRNRVAELEAQKPSNLTLDVTTEAAKTFDPQKFCNPTTFSNLKAISTSLAHHFTVQNWNEFVYLQGDDGGGPPPVGKFRVYRIANKAVLTLVGSLDTTEPFQRMVQKGHYVFGVKTGAGSHKLTIIDIIRPDAPTEISGSPFDILGDNGLSIRRQGKYLHIAVGVSGVKVVDIGTPTSPAVVATIT